MATILSVKYPIIYEPPGGETNFEYHIYDENLNEIFKGYCYGSKVDISGVLRSYMNSSLVDVPNQTVEEGYVMDIETNTVVKQFTVKLESFTSGRLYTVVNDYNDDYITGYDGNYITSDSLTGKYHPDGLVFIDVNSSDKSAVIDSNIERIEDFRSAHITIKKAREEGESVIVEERALSSDEYAPTALACAYLNGRYLIAWRSAYSNSNNILYSDDLRTWTETTTNPGISAQVKWRAYVENGEFLVFQIDKTGNFGSNTYARVSTDGVTWRDPSYRDIASATRKGDMRYIGSNYVYASKYNQTSQNYGLGIGHNQTSTGRARVFLISNLSNSANVEASAMIYAFGKILFFGKAEGERRLYKGTELPTEDTIWDYDPFPGVVDIAKFVNHQVFALGYDDDGSGWVKVSPDGDNWQTLSVDFQDGETPTSIAYGGGNYVITSDKGRIYYSSSLTSETWESFVLRSAENNQNLSDVLWSPEEERFLIVGGASNNFWLVEIKTPPISYLTVNGEDFPIHYTEGCERFSLYWVNRLGGRSQLLLEGKEVEKFANSFYRISTNYNETDPSSFEKRTIHNEVTQSFTLYTGLLTDEQSKKMDDLFTSPKVWLHDHETDRVMSVYITDSSVTRKKYKNNKKYTYTINVAQAQTHLRK